MVYTIGLTGSIGSGKSTVAKIIKNHGIEIVDADEISRELTSKGSPIVDELRESFGDSIIDDAGDLDRRKLAEIAFSSEENKNKLSEIVTMKVVDIIDKVPKELEEKGIKLVVMDIPLLFEYGMENNFDEVWSVVADTDIRYMRANNRDGISREDFDKRDASQVSQLDKIAKSDIVFYNDRDLEELNDKVMMEIKRVKDLTNA